MGEIQPDFFGGEPILRKEPVQMMWEPELKQRFRAFCNNEGFSMTAILKLCAKVILRNREQMTQVMREATIGKEVEIASNEVIGYLPILRKQKELSGDEDGRYRYLSQK